MSVLGLHVWSAALVLCTVAACTPATTQNQHAHEPGGAEHTHGVVEHEHASAPESSSPAKAAPAKPNAENDLEPIGVTVFTQKVLLYLEHAPLIRGTRTRFLAHLTVLATGEPIRAGRATLEVDLPGAPLQLAVPTPARDGLFIPEGVLEAAGKFRARLIIESEAARETLDVGELTVHASVDAARKAAQSAEDPPGAVPFLLEQQWKIKLLLAEASPRTLIERLSVPAVVATPQGAEAVVSPPAAGRLLASESGRLPRVGERVDLDQLLGFIEPPLDASDLAQLRALDLQSESLDLEIDLKSLEVARAIHEAEARLAFADKESTRIANLRAEGLSTVQQQDQAQQDLAVARAHEQAARATRQSLDRLLAARANRSPGREGQTVRLPLVAPISGIVIDARHVVGEYVPSEAELFRLIDPRSVWIEGRITEFDLGRVPDAPGATLSLPAFADRRVDVLPSGGRWLHVGHVVDPATRSLVIRYELPNPEGLFKAGMLATLMLETRKASAALAIPEEAVLLEQGQATAYVMLEGELFQKRDLELGIRDAGFVEVRSGLSAGERVATRGAYIVKLAALSPASFGAGHAH